MKMNIRTKLIGSFLIVVALLLAVFGVSYNGLNNVGGTADTILDEAGHADHVMEIKSLTLSEWQWYTDYALTHDEGSLEEARSIGDEVGTIVAEMRSQLTAEEAPVVDEFLANHTTFVAEIEGMAAAYVCGDWEGANEKMSEVDEASDALLRTLERMEEGTAAAMAAAVASADTTQSNSALIMIVVAIVAAIVAAGLGLFLSHSMSKRINGVIRVIRQIVERDLPDLASATEAMTNGDFTQSVTVQTQRVEINSSDEIGELGQAANEMIGNLRNLIRQVKDTADNLALSSHQINRAAGESHKATGGIPSSL
jgi:methyl-accepting chemotaxis protein